MNRSRLIYRDFDGEGSQESQAYALALAQIAGPDVIESLVHHFSALHEFGGELYIGTRREEVNKGARANPQGRVTVAYVVGYTEKSRIKDNTEEPEETIEDVFIPESVPEPEPEPLEA